MKLDTDNWQLLQDLFHLAEVTPEADREHVLAEKCPDEVIRRRAMKIFDSSRIDGSQETPTPPSALAPDLNGKIGPYTLIRHLGTGGIGAVYLVERMVGGALQRSALKVLAPHSAGPSFIERFHREQHILASLDHPNITRMLDAGLTERGQPYLGMEYVDGAHLDDYCDTRKLGITERLKLFLRVCDAVAYAHRTLVVHLDLKPSNILVTADGTVKLLDFGTSKLIQSDSLLTTTIMATPAYASPEQLRNEPITTSCDIYALGGILFELLAGVRPASRASVAAMIERAIREQEPERLQDAVTSASAEQRGLSMTRLRQMLTGDLATIAQKCLRPRPKDRYPSIDALSGDIQRYLGGRPVLARPQTTLYRLGKFVRRNRGVLAATLLVVIALLASLGYAAWRQQQALREGQRALRMQTFMYRLFKLANSDYTGKPAATVPEFLELGVKTLPEYIKNPADLRAAQISLAESMYTNGDLESAQKVFTQTMASAKAAGDVEAETESKAYAGCIAFKLGQTEQGKALTADALRLSRMPGVSPAIQVRSAICYAYNRDNLWHFTDEDLALLRFAAQKAREANLPPHEKAEAIYNLATDLESRMKPNEAEPLYYEALKIYSEDPLALCEQSAVYGSLAYLSDLRGKTQESLPLYQRSLDGYKACSGADSRDAISQIAFMSGALMELGRVKEAVPLLEGALPAWRRAQGSGQSIEELPMYLSQAYVEVGRFKEADAICEQMTASEEGKFEPNSRHVGAMHLVWARALAGEHRYKEALPHAEIAARILTDTAVPAEIPYNNKAREVLLEIQSKLTPGSGKKSTSTSKPESGTAASKGSDETGY